jgi:1,4-dihydroxy-2-naphthoate octaprenyltransferase
MPEEEESPPLQPQYYLPQPPQFEKHDEFLEGISKQTLILAFAAFFIGLLIGKSMTPVVLRQ